jgi:hypothetical protein
MKVKRRNEMETTIRYNPDLGNIALSAYLIEKVHRCADCPIRKMAVKQPHSVFARLHRWHKTWWPGWKAQEARTCPLAAK